ncbi:formate dehydrogenase accessory protein FdhE [Paraburkholderia sp. BL9I2N2]|uniref:formate dehydrogenase accessory protein FdhE n=1 Tax=Paraburkholderia sp. BL9I2N2 TaxID=1938809 RepID=UPI00104A637A|nr:formate dehydrogenase accessory protein FdhE [Paraburkholderia sp. BL9I2N2]TCK84310.1 FdhE protein [Paraburkholderia sp. BL9I2N2]
MQTFLEPREILTLDRSAIPRIRLPRRGELFAGRAQRLRTLATESHPIGDYLRLMADLAQAQHEILARFTARAVDPSSIARAQQHSMPILPARTGERDPAWREVLESLLSRLEASSEIAPPLAAAVARLRALDDSALEREADALLRPGGEVLDNAGGPFIMAALQVLWTDQASRLTVDQVPYLDTVGLCPVCGSHPVASVVRVGGANQGYRFVACGLCGTESHVVRVKCTHCDSTQGIAYHAIDGRPDWAKAESCEACHTYRKIFYQDKEFGVEPFADDLVSLPLDLLVNEAGYRRPAPHPFLWPAAGQDDDA